MGTLLAQPHPVKYGSKVLGLHTPDPDGPVSPYVKRHKMFLPDGRPGLAYSERRYSTKHAPTILIHQILSSFFSATPAACPFRPETSSKAQATSIFFLGCLDAALQPPTFLHPPTSITKPAAFVASTCQRSSKKQGKLELNKMAPSKEVATTGSSALASIDPDQVGFLPSTATFAKSIKKLSNNNFSMMEEDKKNNC